MLFNFTDRAIYYKVILRQIKKKCNIVNPNRLYVLTLFISNTNITLYSVLNIL